MHSRGGELNPRTAPVRAQPSRKSKAAKAAVTKDVATTASTDVSAKDREEQMPDVSQAGKDELIKIICHERINDLETRRADAHESKRRMPTEIDPNYQNDLISACEERLKFLEGTIDKGNNSNATSDVDSPLLEIIIAPHSGSGGVPQPPVKDCQDPALPIPTATGSVEVTTDNGLSPQSPQDIKPDLVEQGEELHVPINYDNTMPTIEPNSSDEEAKAIDPTYSQRTVSPLFFSDESRSEDKPESAEHEVDAPFISGATGGKHKKKSKRTGALSQEQLHTLRTKHDEIEQWINAKADE
ncbi:hypothetical protein M422DRAFT_276241 [Sphaerobolus stellatus SS14]|uniref:Uncharacterized protein n=1 Tax=Sphaerobolus stellatus (strain SS14) TaxID=990650 RepID=A0A0C9TMY7_SPHS4|nr:hypothetical protein M422DRAFT_276241 [Sphaerobolus stellatus SS14]